MRALCCVADGYGMWRGRRLVSAHKLRQSFARSRGSCVRRLPHIPKKMKFFQDRREVRGGGAHTRSYLSRRGQRAIHVEQRDDAGVLRHSHFFSCWMGRDRFGDTLLQSVGWSERAAVMMG